MILKNLFAFLLSTYPALPAHTRIDDPPVFTVHTETGDRPVLPACTETSYRPGICPRLLTAAIGEESLTIKHIPDFEITGDGSHTNWSKTNWIDIQPWDASGPAYTTRAKVLYSNTGLYFLFHCEDHRLTATLQADFSDLWHEDVAEVFIQPDSTRPAYLEYEISPLNVELPIMVYNEHRNLNSWQPFHYGGDRKTRHSTSVQGGEKKPSAPINGWTTEFFIPYALLKPLMDAPPQSGSRWKGNLYRIDYDNGERYNGKYDTGKYDAGKEAGQLYSWRRTRINFHDCERFGTWIFE